MAGEQQARKPIQLSDAWREARELVWARRGRLSLGLALMLVNRVAGLVLPMEARTGVG